MPDVAVARFAVFGHPVAHSLSPRIHAAFGRQTGIGLEYVAIDAAPADFAAALHGFAAGGGRGANVTLPLKEAAFALAATASDRARRAGAVNTLVREALKRPDIGGKLTSLGAEVAPTTPAEAQRFLASEVARWTQLIREEKIPPQN